jgi:tyrosine-protein phosphatase YwqE
VVLAHPERYHYLNINDFQDLISRGVLLQINWLSLIGYYSNQVKIKAENLISENIVSFIGTDCHNTQHAELFKKCQNNKAWHLLMDSGNLLNSKL